jgi:hypothetical protein
MSEGMQIARRRLEAMSPYYGQADNPALHAILRELINHCEWQERVIAEMSQRLDEIDNRTKGSIRR